MIQWSATSSLNHTIMMSILYSTWFSLEKDRRRWRVGMNVLHMFVGQWLCSFLTTAQLHRRETENSCSPVASLTRALQTELPTAWELAQTQRHTDPWIVARSSAVSIFSVISKSQIFLGNFLILTSAVHLCFYKTLRNYIFWVCSKFFWSVHAYIVNKTIDSFLRPWRDCDARISSLQWETRAVWLRCPSN